MPTSVQIAVPKRSHTPVRIYDAARTAVDLMRFRKRFGEPIARAALHRYLAAPGARPALLLDYAGALGTFGPLRAALDIATALSELSSGRVPDEPLDTR